MTDRHLVTTVTASCSAIHKATAAQWEDTAAAEAVKMSALASPADMQAAAAAVAAYGNGNLLPLDKYANTCDVLPPPFDSGPLRRWAVDAFVCTVTRVASDNESETMWQVAAAVRAAALLTAIDAAGA